MQQEHFRLRPDVVPLQWHEAVAVVQVVARHLMASDAEGPVPAVAGLAVDHQGIVHVLEGPRTPATIGDGPTALAALLGDLLRGAPSTPASLASLAERDAASPRFESVVDFSQALVFFERPLSQHNLAAHAARLATAQEQHRLNEELEQLTQKARDVEPTPRQNEARSISRGRAGRKVATAVLFAAFVILAMSVGALTGWNTAGSESMRDVGSRIVERVRTETKTVLSSTPVQPATQSAAGSARSDRPRPHRRPVVHPPNRSAMTEPPVVEPPPRSPSTAIAGGETEPRIHVTFVDVTPYAAAEIGVDAAGTPSVYSRANREVEPPVILRPQIRSEPAVGGHGHPQLATLILDIDDDGSVSQVRLASVSAAERYYAAMLVAAAKAWRFRPAQKNGTPVRYRLLLRVAQ